MSGVGFTARHVSVHDLISSCQQLRIPAYQRGYSWTTAEAEALLSDIDTSLAEGRGHFLGAVVLARMVGPAASANGAFEVIDGQQRLTTLTILLCVLRDLERDPTLSRALHALVEAPEDVLFEREAGFRLTLNRFDAAFFRDEVQRSGATRFLKNDVPTGGDSRSLIVDVALFLSEALNQRPVEARRELARHVLSGCGMVWVETPDADYGYTIFRVLNSRGKPLESYDLIKGELFEASGLEPAEAEAYARDWSGYAASMGQRRFGEMLQTLRLIHDRGMRGDLIAGLRSGILSTTQPRRVLDEYLPAHVEAELALSECRVESGKQSAAVNASVSFLGMLDNTSWRMAAVQYLVRRPDDPDAMRDFFEELERLMFVLRLTGADRPRRLQRLRAILDCLDRDRDLFGPGGPFALQAGEADTARRRMRSKLANYPLRRALTFRLNAVLPGGEILTSDSDATVEHVLPLSPMAGSDWLTHWPDPEERRELCNTLGNFVLLSHQQNQAVDRNPYSEKCVVYFAGGRAEFALTREISGHSVWTPEVVRERTRRLSGVLEHVWHLDRA